MNVQAFMGKDDNFIFVACSALMIEHVLARKMKEKYSSCFYEIRATDMILACSYFGADTCS